MARFNYQAAREGGMSDADIVQFLDDERAEGNEYEVDPSAGRMLMLARSQTMEEESPEALENPPWYADPIDMAAGINPARMLSRDIPRMAGAAGGMLQRPFVKKAAEVGANVATGGRFGLLRGLSRMLGREPAPPPPMMPPNATAVPSPGMVLSESPRIPVYDLLDEGAEAAAPVLTRSMRQPIRGGREADAFRRGGQAELDILRRTGDEQAAKAALAKRMGAVEPQAPSAPAELPPASVSAPAPAAAPVPKGMRAVRGHLRGIPKPKPKPELPAAVQKRIAAAKPEPPKVKAEAKAPKSRHDVQYFSGSQNKYINIEDMNQKHIEQAYRKIAATSPKQGSVAARQLDALLDESKHRLKTTGIHVGQTGLPKPVIKRIEMVKQAAKAAPRRSKALSEKAGAKAAGSKDLSSLLKASVDLGAEMEKRGIHGAQRTEAYRLLREMNQ
jgi:hypothetical protein